MRIGVIGDVHLGASYSLGYKDHKTGRNTRLLDYENTLELTIQKLVDEECEVIVFTGDIFEHRHPNALYQKIFSAKLRFAIESGIKEIHIVVGNHDQQRQSNATTISYLQELALPNIVVHDELSSVTLEKAGQPEANLLFMPYRDRKWFGVETYAEAIKQIDIQLKYELSSIDNDAPKILIGHMTMEGTFFASEDEELYGDNELYLPVEMFKNIDVTLMGHVHSPYVISKDPYVAYVGSMEKRGAFEKHDKKYAIINTRTKSVDYGVEPCRNIYDIKVDLSDAVCGEKLFDEIKSCIRKFAKTKALKNAIVRVPLAISADDVSFCSPLDIEAHLRDIYKVSYCVPVKPSLFFSRQVRDSKINEHSTDTEAFIRFVKNTIDDEKLAKEITSAGLDIIKAESAE